MKRLVTITICTLSNKFAFADVSLRGKTSDLSDYSHGEYEYFIPIAILLVLGLIFAYAWFKGVKEKLSYNDNLKELIRTICKWVKIAVSILYGLVLLWAFYKEFVSDTTQNEQTETANEIVNEEFDNNNFETESNAMENNASPSNNTLDPWASFPPVIDHMQDNTAMKENDFLLAAISNPSFTLYDYYVILKLNPDNTQFVSFERYCRSTFIRERYTPKEFNSIYNHIAKAWPIFIEIRNTNFDSPGISQYMMEYNPFDTSTPRIENASSPELIKKLKIKPLYY